MKRWYVVQVYAGSEEMVKEGIARRVQEENLQDKIGQVLVPAAKAKPSFRDIEASKDEQLFPGYILVEAEISPQVFRLVVTSPRVVRFLGGKNPVPLGRAEVDRVLRQISGEVVISAKKSDFAVGGEVDINDGPFAGFVGIIEKIDEESERLTVMVSIFGRMTPVELGFNQVKQ